MASRKLIILIAAFAFLLLAAASLYRLLTGLSVVIAGAPVGMTASFFGLVICAALSLMLFLAARDNR